MEGCFAAVRKFDVIVVTPAFVFAPSIDAHSYSLGVAVMKFRGVENCEDNDQGEEV